MKIISAFTFFPKKVSGQELDTGTHKKGLKQMWFYSYFDYVLIYSSTIKDCVMDSMLVVMLELKKDQTSSE